jgi:ATP-dependent RNA helicase SUPV3L1/SUV3
MNISTRPAEPALTGGRNVVAVLGPTNTGKTHLAIERMLAHSSGMIGLPLRLLAREVYDRVVAKAGPEAVALVTGEEKIIPANPRFTVSTVEAMPSTADVAFLAIDEIQVASDLERGHVFTDRMLNLRGRQETLLLGAPTMRGIVERLLPGVNVVTRPRLSVLSYAGSKKITRLPRRSAVVAFSADEVYAIAELIRRQRGGAAVVLGALSPRTRNAQVQLFQSGDVDFLVATDAIGMGLNLDVDHVAFAGDTKFDGYQYRKLTAAELGQISGRAGRYTRNGTFGVTGRVDGFEDDLVEALETHRFDSVKTVQWRNRDLDFRSIDALKLSLEMPPPAEGLVRALPADDIRVLETARRDPEMSRLAEGRARVELLWEVCQVPDYRRIAPANHAELAMTLFGYLARKGAVDEDWFARQVDYADRTDGDIDTLANRIAHIRTWTFAANRPRWLTNPGYWQERTRAIEDRLSDALHERLTQRFVDRRTSVLMRRLRENAMLEAEITDAGDVMVEGQHVGQLLGFRFAPDPSAGGEDAKALRAAAQKALVGEIERRAQRVGSAGDPEFVLAADGQLRWQGNPVARLVEGEDALQPRFVLLADETLTGPAQEQVQKRLELWLNHQLTTQLAPLFDLKNAAELAPLARGIAFRLVENLGVLERATIAEEVKSLDQEMRAGLRKLGVRFGAYHIYVPQLLKPAPSRLLAILWALKNGGLSQPGIAELPQLSASGRTTIPVDPTFPRPLYRVVGFRIAGQRAVRLDILERLADLIRPLIAWRPTPDGAAPPPGAVEGNGFMVTPAMTSLLGSSGEDFASVLRSLGYRVERRPAPPKVAEPAMAPTEASTEIAAAESAVAEPTAAEVETTTAGESEASGDVVAEAAEVDAGSEPAVEAAIAAEPAPEGTAGEEVAAGSEPGAALEAGAESAVTVEAPVEPQFIEIWRPGRPDRNRPRRPNDRPRGNRAANAAPADGATSSDGAAEGERRPRGDRPDRGPRRGKGGRGEGAEGERPARGPRRDDRRGREDRDNRREDRGQAQAGDGRERPKREDRPPRREEPRRERPIDPDSPFAALAALKADLERQKRG